MTRQNQWGARAVPRLRRGLCRTCHEEIPRLDALVERARQVGRADFAQQLGVAGGYYRELERQLLAGRFSAQATARSDHLADVLHQVVSVGEHASLPEIDRQQERMMEHFERMRAWVEPHEMPQPPGAEGTDEVSIDDPDVADRDIHDPDVADR